MRHNEPATAVSGEPFARSELLDVADIDFAKLAAMPESVLRASLRRILTECGSTPNRYSAFQNSL